MQELKLVSFDKVILTGKFEEVYTHKIIGLQAHVGLQTVTQYKVKEKFNYFDFDSVEHSGTLLEINKISDFTYELVMQKYSIDRDIILSTIFPNRDLVKYDTHIHSVTVSNGNIRVTTYNDMGLDKYLLSNKYFKTYATVNNLSVYNFFIPSRYLEDIELLIEGKYSKLSESIKSATMRFCSGVSTLKYLGSKIALSTKLPIKVESELVYIVQVFNKSPALRRRLELEYKVKLNKNSELHSKIKQAND